MRMNEYEWFVCGLYLSEWPSDASIDEIYDSITQGRDDVTVWEPIDMSMTADRLIETMKSTIDELKQGFTPKAI